MNIGDNIYYIKTISNTFSRQKIKMIDADGIEWCRYDKPIVEVSMETHTIVGKISATIEGTIDENDMVENRYYTDKGMNFYESEIDDTIYSPYWITDETATQKILVKLREKYAD